MRRIAYMTIHIHIVFLGQQALNALPESLAILATLDSAADKSHTTLFLAVGMRNGVLLRTVLDSHSGEMSDPRLR